ncbi:GNAT family N-acetyltransferase [Psychromicrobium xiongbiense]|uniref:GNAT family N-acetyltransferase n=1 Tax=Psychromicrobium xiongbiense TaxID=3051184 RepID=UPI0025537460|nr:GNAT family N-acetyltransferase [Psychromicrobium sp. YIM S02556]
MAHAPERSSRRALVRPLRPSDADAVAHVHVQAWRETYAGLLSPAFLAALRVEDRAALWRRVAENPDVTSRHWVAEADGVVVGFAGVRPMPAAEAVRPEELWGLYLLQSYQGLGLGRELIEAAIGKRPASLWVAAGNDHAIGFYQHCGFTADGTEEFVADWENLKELRMIR